MLTAVYGNRAQSVRKFISDCDVIRGLNNLEGIRHISGARHSGQKTISFCGVSSHPLCIVLALFRQCLRLIWDLITFDDALSRWNPQLSCVVLNIPRCSVQYLPNTVQVRFSIGSSRQNSRACCLRRSRRIGDADHNSRGKRNCDGLFESVHLFLDSVWTIVAENDGPKQRILAPGKNVQDRADVMASLETGSPDVRGFFG